MNASRICCTVSAVILGSTVARAETTHTIDESVKSFVSQHCIVCHGGDANEGGLRFDQLSDNLPVLLAGGGLKRAGHVIYDRENNLPMSNLFVRMQ